MEDNKALERANSTGNVVDITKHLRNCQYCTYNDDGACVAPGGYEYDWRRGVCHTFRRKPDGGGE